MPRRAVFLDRDGVLTIPIFRDGRSYAARTLEEFRLYPDVKDAVRRLKKEDFLVIVATNQPDVTTGKLAPRTLEEMHARLMRDVPLDDIEVSFATRDAPDDRRKPEPGMLWDAAKKWDIDLKSSYIVGDRASDITCGIRAGCKTVFVDLGYTAEGPPTKQNATVANLAEATVWICADSRR